MFQENRFAELKTPLGTDALLFSRMTGQEALGRLFEYEIDCLAENTHLDNPHDLLGKDMTVSLVLNSGDKRHFHGLVTSIRHQGAQNNSYLYRVVLRPWLWFLTRSSHCRIFQNKSVPDILQAVLSDYQSLGAFKLDLTDTGRYQKRDYCVQYRESDFDFVSRLMEDEGMFYFFQHEENKHTLIIGDDIGAYQTISDFVSIPYFPPDNAGRAKEDHIYDWHTAHQVQSGSYALTDYDFENPPRKLFTKANQPKSHAHADGAQYDYPGNYHTLDKGDHYSNVRLEELQSEYEVIQGSSNALGMTAGMLFKLEDYYVDSENLKHIVIEAQFSLSSNQYLSGAGGESHYECQFKAIRASQRFRPQRLTPVPFVQGPQTAVVVGKQGEEIWTDKYGRVKVQFHWDRDGKQNDESSCWVRVATPIAGNRWGWVSIPRIGQEVVVSFLEGNPDRPLITGSVYNANQMPPYELPKNQTQSGIKTRSSKEGTRDNFNELRFEDKKDNEQVYLHAEKNLDTEVKASESRSVGGSRSTTIHTDDNLTVQEGNYTVTVSQGKVKISAELAIDLEVGGSKISMTQSMISIKSDVIMLNSNGVTTIAAGGAMQISGHNVDIN